MFRCFLSTPFRLILSFALLAGCLAACASPEPVPPTLAASPTATTPPAEAVDTLRIRVTDKDSPPFYYHDTSGQWTGLEVEMARALAVEAGFTPEFIGLPWSRALESIKNGEIDLMMNVTQTDERSEYMAWVGPERLSRMVLAVRKEDQNLPIQTLDDLVKAAAERNSKFGIKQDTIYSTEFNERLKTPEFAQWFEMVPDELLNPPKVVNGRILGWFQDETMVRYVIAKTPEYAGLVVHSFALVESEVFFGVSKGVSVGDLARLQAAYQRLEQNGVFDEIRARIWK